MDVRWLVVFALTGCLEPTYQTCGDLVCPAGATCLAERNICVSAAAIETCMAEPDGALCSADGIDGRCDRGLCVGSVCGDGVATGREQCDGSATRQCSDFGFYYGDLACNDSCLYDTSGCSGTCGDQLVQSDAGEVCDGGSPIRGCFELGYDYGHVTCTARCNDSSLLDCGRFAPQPIYEAGVSGSGFDAHVVDVYRVGDLFVAAKGEDGLGIIDRGMQREYPGFFNFIAARGSTVIVSDEMFLFRVDHTDLVPLAAVPNSQLIASAALLPDGSLWAAGMGCALVRLGATIATTWTVMPSPASATSCGELAADEAGGLYLRYSDAASNSHVAWWTGTAWQDVTLTGQPFRFNRGHGGHLNAIVRRSADFALAELIDGVATDLQLAGSWIDAVGVGDAYLAVGNGILRIGAPPDVALPLDFDGTDGVRRMDDGSVLTRGSRVFEIEPIQASERSFQGIVGVVTGSAGLVQWDPDQIFGPVGSRVPGFPVLDVAEGPGAMVYAALGSAGLTWGRLDGSGWSVDTRISPTRVWTDATGDLAVISNGRILALPSGAPAWTIVRDLGEGCPPTVLLGMSLTDLYASTPCVSGGTIDHYDGTSWTTVLTAPGGKFDHVEMDAGATLADGTIVLVGSKIWILHAGTWTTLSSRATAAAGTSYNDLWFAGVRVTGQSPGTLAHWNGVELVKVRSPDPDPPAVIAVTAGTIATGSRTYVRWAVP